MSFINKVKNFFYEDIEEDDEEFEAREAAKREAKLRKAEEKRRRQEQDNLKDLITPEELIKPANDDLSERQLFEAERTFNFPMDLGDDIFDDNDEVEEPKQEETRRAVKEEKNIYARTTRVDTRTSRLDPVPSIRETRKVEPTAAEETSTKFRPSPVVSPVYGILDKNYTVDDVVDKNLDKTKEFSIEKKSVDFDTVRNRAYKDLDDEIEKTLTKTKDIFFNLDEEEVKEQNEGVIEDYVEPEYDKNENEDSEEVIITYEGENEEETPVVEAEPVQEETEEEDDDDISPDVEIPKPVKKTRRSKKVKDEEPEEDKEKEDLFNLIDNMYNEEEDEEEED